MTFIAMTTQKSVLTQQKDLLEFEQMCYSNEYSRISEELDDYLSDDDNDSDDNYACRLEAQQEYYDSKKESIESQLQVINAELESYDKAIQTNIKSDCSVKFSV